MLILCIKGQDGECALVELESACNAAAVGLSMYITQGKGRLTKLVQDYDAGKTKYSAERS
jgi:hypothetical protein